MIYFLQVNVALGLFYCLYRLFFYKDTFWIVRRIYFWGIVVCSLLFPFIQLDYWKRPEPILSLMPDWSLIVPDVSASEIVQPQSFDWVSVFFVVYGVISLLFLLRLFIQLLSVYRLNRKYVSEKVCGVDVKVSEACRSPFSFGRSVYLNPALYDQEALQEVVFHEYGHARQLHTLDVIFYELLLAVCWINPFVWLLRKEMKDNLEFLADDYVLKQEGCDVKHYQYHLLEQALDMPAVQIINKFNVSHLKKRIIMMKKEKTKKMGLLKYSLVIPLLAVLVLACDKQKSSDQMMAVVPLEVYGLNAPDSVQMPQFPSEISENIYTYMSENLHYPKEAEQSGEEGTVVVQFVVEKDGRISQGKIIRSVSSTLDHAALAFVENLPRWIPGYYLKGEKAGEKVDILYTLPIRFSLDGSKSDLSVGIQNDASKGNPLIIVDGEVMGADFDLNSISTNKIDVVNVYKEGEAYSEYWKKYGKEYGDRIKFGVIEIKTRRG